MAGAEGSVVNLNAAKQGDSAESTHGIHKLLTFMKCRRLYGYRYVLNLRPDVESTATTLGTAVHGGLEHHYLGGDWMEEMRRLRQKPAFSYVIDDALRILKSYFTVYRHEHLDVIAVEREYKVWIDGMPFTRRVDLVYRKDGLAFLVDHKTASDTGKRTMQVEFDPTLMSQELVGRIAIPQEHPGLKFGGVVLNMIPTRATGGRYFRMNLRFPPRLVSEMPKSLGVYLKAEAAVRASATSPWDYPQNLGSCYDKYGICSYWKLCANGPEALGEYVAK